MTIVIASDHAGTDIKARVEDVMKDLGYDFEDISPQNEPDDDYPDFAKEVSERVQEGDKGFVSCGTGIGSVMAANVFEGVRAARPRTVEEARLSRKKNNANVLVLGNNQEFDRETLKELVQAFYETEFAGGRHARRVGKIRDYK